VKVFTDREPQGLDDLRNGIIRTPLPPKETFLDDPLRILRCVRFASRLGFDIVPEVKAAIKDAVIQASTLSFSLNVCAMGYEASSSRQSIS